VLPTSTLFCMDARFRPSPLALAVLCLLHVGPLHPYGIQRLIKEWGKDEVVNVGNRANLYKTIKRLNEAGLIAIRQTERDQLYPERTVYELTEQGRREAVSWLDDMLSTPRNEFPEFPAALSFAMMLGPDGLLGALERRAAQLADRVTELDASLKTNSGTVPRVALIEDEYLRAVSAAELAWLRGLAGELRSGTLTWSKESLEAALTMPNSAIPGPAD